MKSKPKKAKPVEVIVKPSRKAIPQENFAELHARLNKHKQGKAKLNPQAEGKVGRSS